MNTITMINTSYLKATFSIIPAIIIPLAPLEIRTHIQRGRLKATQLLSNPADFFSNVRVYTRRTKRELIRLGSRLVILLSLTLYPKYICEDREKFLH